jgi:hypothetical protein
LLRKAQSNRAFDEGPTYANRSKPTLTAFILDGEHGKNCQRVNMVPQSPHVRCWVDIVAKVENRTTLKISRKLTFGFLRCCVAFQRDYGGP